MPFFDSVPGIEASIWVGNDKLEEYEDDEEENAAKTTSRYIESKSESEYSIRVEVDQSYYFDSETLIFEFSIDGKKLLSQVMRDLEHPRVNNRLIKPGTMKCDGVQEPIPGKPGHELLRKFKFSKIETSTDEAKYNDLKQDSDRISNAGEIKIEVIRGGAATPATGPSQRIPVAANAENVHEKALQGQAKWHTTSFGASEIRKENRVRTPRFGTIATFKFKYRSKDALKSLLIIKRSPSPDSKPEVLSAGAF